MKPSDLVLLAHTESCSFLLSHLQNFAIEIQYFIVQNQIAL